MNWLGLFALDVITQGFTLAGNLPNLPIGTLFPLGFLFLPYRFSSSPHFSILDHNESKTFTLALYRP